VAQPAKATAAAATAHLDNVLLIVASFGGAAAVGCNAWVAVEIAILPAVSSDVI